MTETPVTFDLVFNKKMLMEREETDCQELDLLRFTMLDQSVCIS